MGSIQKILSMMYENPAELRYEDVCHVCDVFFGEPRMRGSHRIYKTPWPGDPRINIQNKKGRVPRYQIVQVLAAIEKLEGETQ